MTGRPEADRSAAAESGPAGNEPLGGALLEVRDLRAGFPTRAGLVRAVDGVSFEVRRGRTLSIVGESGCGKSATALAMLGLLPERAHVSGSILFGGRDLAGLGRRALEEDRKSVV